MRSLIQLLLLFLIVSTANSQKEISKALGIPEHFKSPRDKRDAEYVSYLQDKSKYDKSIPWIVYSDRNNNITYAKPDEQSQKQSTLDFKTAFYVIEDQGDWIRIAYSGRALEPGNLKFIKGAIVEDKGWIMKKNMILWSSTLRNPDNGIFLKSLLLYSIKSKDLIREGNPGKTVKFYSGPGIDFSEEKAQALYSFLFILKRENGWLLLTMDNNIDNLNKDERVLGWVAEENQASWNTRLALEPNFEKEAYNERKNNDDLRVKVFNNSVDADNYYKAGTFSPSQLLGRYDPLYADLKELDDKEGTRFKGYKMRLPALASEPTYFKTGLLSQLGDKDSKSQVLTDALRKVYVELKQSASKFNVVFLIEARASMRKDKSAIIAALQTLKENLNSRDDGFTFTFNIAFYRHAKMNKQLPFFKMEKNLTNLNQVIEKVNTLDFIDDETTPVGALNYALQQSLLKAGFAENQTNILFLIANNPDFSMDQILSLKCKACKEKVKSEEIADQLVSKQVNIAIIQPTFNDENLKEGAEGLLLDKSNGLNNKNLKLNELLKSYFEISTPEILSNNNHSVIKGNYLSEYYGPANGTNRMNPKELENALIASMDSIYVIRKVYCDFFNKTLLNGDSYSDAIEDNPSVGEFGPLVLDKINSIFKSMGTTPDPNIIKLLVKRKVSIYSEGYVARKSAKAKYPSLSPVLFFPIEELKDYIDELENLTVLKGKPGFEMQQGLQNTLKTLFLKYTGDKKKKSSKELKELDLNEICKALAGNGFDFNRPGNFKLRDLTSKNIGDEILNKFIEDINIKKAELVNMINRSSKYLEYVYYSPGGETYYWIPFDKTF